MKISWGVGITIAIIVFTFITLWFVYFSFSHDVNLVREDYYEAEIKFDETKETIERTKNLEENLSIKLADKNIKLVFPSQFNHNNTLSGAILLYRPSDRALDINKSIKVDSNNVQYISAEPLKSGMWKIKVSWLVDSLSYFNEQIIMVE